MRLIGYIRVSTDEQKDGHSLAIQDQTIHKYCDLYGHDLVEVIVDEGVSAGTELQKRPGGSLLVDALREGQADGVVFTDLDRAFRLTIDGLETVNLFERAGLSIHCVNEKIDTSDPDGLFILTIKLAAAERERNKIRFRASKTSAGLREQGRAWGPTPYGCVRDGDKLYRDPVTWAVREEIVALWNDGDGLSMNAIATELRERGHEAPGGGRLWHRSTLRGLIQSHHDLKHIPPLEAAPEASASEIAVARKLAEGWRKENGYIDRGGYVLVFDGEVNGWIALLTNPEKKAPGCIAVRDDGKCWVAAGGDERNGAKSWNFVFAGEDIEQAAS